MHEWIKDKDPDNKVVDIASENCCECCLLKDIPEELKGMWVFTEQQALMKEALYASVEFRQNHQNSEIICLLDLQPEITVRDLALVFGRWQSNRCEIAQKELIKFFFINGKLVNLDTVLTDEEIEWINQRSDDLFELVDRAVGAERRASEAKKIREKSCSDELEELLNK